MCECVPPEVRPRPLAIGHILNGHCTSVRKCAAQSCEKESDKGWLLNLNQRKTAKFFYTWWYVCNAFIYQPLLFCNFYKNKSNICECLISAFITYLPLSILFNFSLRYHKNNIVKFNNEQSVTTGELSCCSQPVSQSHNITIKNHCSWLYLLAGIICWDLYCNKTKEDSDLRYSVLCKGYAVLFMMFFFVLFCFLFIRFYSLHSKLQNSSQHRASHLYNFDQFL